jgi:hypothetical protein
VTDRLALVRERELRDLVDLLDQAAANLISVDDIDTEVVDAVQRAAELLHDLRLRG